MADLEAFPFSTYEGIWALLAGPDAPVVACGQAVNFWAERFFSDEPRLEELQPFMSKDLDLLGSMASAEMIANATRSEIWRAPPRGATPVLANIHLKAGDKIHLVQVLRSIAGLRSSEVEKHAIAVEIEGCVIRISDPISLLVGKIYNVAHIDQKNRHDAQHVKILRLCVPVFLMRLVGEAEKNARAVRPCLNDLERVLALSASADAAKVGVELGINWLEMIPLTALRESSNPKLRAFAEKRLKHWQARQ